MVYLLFRSAISKKPLQNIFWPTSSNQVQSKQSCGFWCFHEKQIASPWHTSILADPEVGGQTEMQWVLRFSSGNRALNDKPCSGWKCTAVTNKMKSVWICTSAQNGGLWPGNCTQRWTVASVHWKQCSIANFAQDGSHEHSHKNRKNTVHQLARNNWTSMRLQVSVSWVIITSDVVWCQDHKPESKEPESMQWQHENSLWKKKFKIQSSVGITMCTVFWDRKGRGDPSGFARTWAIHQLLPLSLRTDNDEGLNFQTEVREDNYLSLSTP